MTPDTKIDATQALFHRYAEHRRRFLWVVGSILAAAGVALVVLTLGFGARVDAPTLGLAAVAAALVYALGQLYALVRALSQPDTVAVVGAVADLSQAELREEKRRLLRAIKELEFDHGMGKLSLVDFEAVIATYRLRAIEVMRALDHSDKLHPALAQLLEQRTQVADPTRAPAPTSEQPTCSACGGLNDRDARFCKHCGAALTAAQGGAA